MRKKIKKLPRILTLLLAMLFLVTSCMLPVYGEEEGSYEESYEEEEAGEEETEYIPEEYYDPIQSNDISGWPQGIAVQAASAVVMDLDTNTLLYSKSAYEKRYPASITKIMTAMLALELGDLDAEITFSENVYDLEEGSSHVGIQPGEKMTLRQALCALMLESANDSAVGIAEFIGGSVSGFADLMNAKAQELGCTNTHFTNPHGLHDEDHYTCAYDMALIAQAAYEMPEFRELVSTVQSTCPVTNLTEEERYFVNHHKMLQEDSEYYQDWCTGGKTGFTSDAWNTLVTYGEKNGMRLVCVLLRENGAGRAYLETTELMNYGFENFQEQEMIPQSEAVSFYQAMKLDYPGWSSKMFQAEELKQKIVEIGSGKATLPLNVDISQLTIKSEDIGNNTRSISYLYYDWPVGMAWMKINPEIPQVTLSYEQKLDMTVLRQSSTFRKAQNEVEQTAMLVVDKTKELVDKAREFAEKNIITVILAGSVLLVLLIIIITILIVRCTRESRIQKRRRQEEKERLRKAEEIDQMTTAQIEQELREAMEQERQRLAQEEALREQQRNQEEKLRETERILEEINNRTQKPEQEQELKNKASENADKKGK